MKEEVKVDALQQLQKTEGVDVMDEWLDNRIKEIVEKIEEVEDLVVKLRIDLFHKADEAKDKEERWRFLNLASWLEKGVEWYLYKAKEELEDY